MIFQGLIAAPIPPEVAVTFGLPLSYAIRELPSVEDPLLRVDGKPARIGSQPDGSFLIEVAGKIVRIPSRKQDGFALTVDAVAGRDGSFLVSRFYRTERGERRDEFIRVGNQETPITENQQPVTVSSYVDAQNYVGTTFDPSGVPRTFSVSKGAKTDLGIGNPVYKGEGEDILVSIPVSPGGVPTGAASASTRFLRLYRSSKPHDIGFFSYVGTTSDRRYVLASNNLIAEWKDGQILSARRIPEAWEPVTVSPNGDVLIRLRDEVEDGVTPAVRPWQVALLQGSTMRSLAFPRPPGTQAFFWRYRSGFETDGTIQFDAFHHDKEVRFMLSPAPARG